MRWHGWLFLQCALGTAISGFRHGYRYCRRPLIQSQKYLATPTTIGSGDQLAHTNDLFTTAASSSDRYPPPLSIIIPAYNEVSRIGDTLLLYQTYLAHSKLWHNQSDIWVIDDGSSDGTSRFVAEFVQNKTRSAQPKGSLITNGRNDIRIHCLTSTTNEGKGAAIARGMQELAAACTAPHQRRIVLVADADASGNIHCLEDMWYALDRLLLQSTTKSVFHDSHNNTIAGSDIPADENDNKEDDEAMILSLLPAALVVGRRDSPDISLLRWWLRHGFRWTVRTICGDLGVTDTQCGFKLMTLTAGMRLYQNLHLSRWTHDVEVLLRARHWNISVTEHPVLWKDQDGSKLVQPSQLLSLIGVIWIMLWQVIRLRWEYDVTGNWKTPR